MTDEVKWKWKEEASDLRGYASYTFYNSDMQFASDGRGYIFTDMPARPLCPVCWTPMECNEIVFFPEENSPHTTLLGRATSVWECDSCGCAVTEVTHREGAIRYEFPEGKENER